MRSRFFPRFTFICEVENTKPIIWGEGNRSDKVTPAYICVRYDGLGLLHPSIFNRTKQAGIQMPRDSHRCAHHTPWTALSNAQYLEVDSILDVSWGVYEGMMTTEKKWPWTPALHFLRFYRFLNDIWIYFVNYRAIPKWYLKFIVILMTIFNKQLCRVLLSARHSSCTLCSQETTA